MANMKQHKFNAANWGKNFNRRDFLRGASTATILSMMGGVPLVGADAPAPAAAPAEVKKPSGPPFPIGVIGLGAQGREIVNRLSKIPTSVVVGLCDTYEKSATRAKEAAPEAEIYTDYTQLLANKKIKGVVVATPTHQHRKIVEDALAAGKHVYCEAPLAHTVDDARAIAQAAAKAPRCNFQAGLQRRSDTQIYNLQKFVLSGAWGTPLKARAQWAKKTSWRRTAPNPEREKALNWRLYDETSTGLVGEIGIHQIDLMTFFFKAKPKSVTGFGAVQYWSKDNDDRSVFDTAQMLFEFPNKVGFYYDVTLANSFEGDYEALYGSDAAIVIRGANGWMFKESDAPQLGWEVYAKKEDGVAYKEAGISLRADATKIKKADVVEEPYSVTSMEQALTAFIRNSNMMAAEVENFDMAYDPKDEKALREYLTTTLKPVRQNAAGYQEGFDATVLVIKTNESVIKGEKVVFSKEWFQL